jgi:hypothetical protein
VKRYLSVLILLGTLFAQGHKQEVHANCCLCMCRAKDETKCSATCIKLQHSKRIIELPEMNTCTKSCKRVHVKQI